MPDGVGMEVWFGVLELPFLFGCVFAAFMTANALRGGAYGRGMLLMAMGFLVMGIGHLHMQITRFTEVNVFVSLFGESGGAMAWIVALIITWSLSGAGFYSMYRASKA